MSLSFRCLLGWRGYALVLSLWGVFAGVAVPVAILMAYRNPALPLLGRAITGRDVYPVGHYLGLWWPTAATITGVLLFAGLVGFLLTERSRTRIREFMSDGPRLGLSSALLVAIGFGGLIGWAEALPRMISGYINRHPMLTPAPEILWMAPLAAGLVAGFGTTVAALVLKRAGGVPLRALLLMLTGIAAYTFVSAWRWGIHPAAAVLLGFGAGVQLSGWAVKRGRRFLDPALKIGVGVPVAIALIAAGMAVAERAAESGAADEAAGANARGSNVILVILDTVRRQNLSLYDYERRTTPRLKHWAGRGAVFRTAVAPSSWTLPTHAAMFTGRMPFETEVNVDRPLGDGDSTVAELLSRRGYLTAGFVANLGYAARSSGLDRGFGVYRDHPATPAFILNSSQWTRWAGRWLRSRSMEAVDIGFKTGERINREFFDWLEGTAGRPFFAFLNYADAHTPFVPHAAFDTLFGGPPPFTAHRQLRERAAVRADSLENGYDRAIAYLDAEIGRFLDGLERRGALENTYVIITSDHGEQFGTHGLQAHGNSLYTPLILVPLVVLGPTVPPGVTIREPASLRDLARTMLDFAGATDAIIPGGPLPRFWNGDSPADELVVSELLAAESSIVSPVSLRSAIYRSFHRIVDEGGGDELYDYDADPWEGRPLDPAVWTNSLGLEWPEAWIEAEPDRGGR